MSAFETRRTCLTVRLRGENKSIFCSRSSDAGFTLVEMLVSLVILAVMAGLMAGFLSQMRTVTRIENDVTARMEIEAVRRYIERAITFALPLPLLGSSIEKRLLLEGAPDRIRFVSIVRQGTQSKTLRETGIGRLRTPESSALIQNFSHRRAIRQEAPDSDQAEVILRKDVQAIAFEYLGQNGGWSDHWETSGELPKAVRFQITMHKDGRTISTRGIAILSAWQERNPPAI